MNSKKAEEAIPDLLHSPLSDVIKDQLYTYFASHDCTNSTTGMYDIIMPHMERPLIELVLEYTEGNQLKAAAMLGINRNTLRKKIKLLEIRNYRYTE